MGEAPLHVYKGQQRLSVPWIFTPFGENEPYSSSPFSKKYRKINLGAPTVCYPLVNLVKSVPQGSPLMEVCLSPTEILKGKEREFAYHDSYEGSLKRRYPTKRTTTEELASLQAGSKKRQKKAELLFQGSETTTSDEKDISTTSDGEYKTNLTRDLSNGARAPKRRLRERTASFNKRELEKTPLFPETEKSTVSPKKLEAGRPLRPVLCRHSDSTEVISSSSSQTRESKDGATSSKQLGKAAAAAMDIARLVEQVSLRLQGLESTKIGISANMNGLNPEHV